MPSSKTGVRRPLSGRRVRDREDAQQLLTRWRATGDTLRGFCRREDVNVCSLSAHKRWIESPPAEAPSPPEPLAFVEVVGLPTAAPPPPAQYTLRFHNGRALAFDERFSEDVLRRLLPLVETC